MVHRPKSRRTRLEGIKAELGKRIRAARGIGPPLPLAIAHRQTYVQLVLAFLNADSALNRYNKHRQLPHKWHALRREHREQCRTA